ncbi:ZCHC3 protein, partial [Polyodon spathula]|nr:ZCHC3 protein [Polyodon spathula]
LTINLFDMNVSDESVTWFLRRYMDVLSGPRYRRDGLGVWNGQRQYSVLLREDPNGYQGFLHPPAKCRVGGVNGYILYSGQPPFCRKCQKYGHSDQNCEELRCFNCGEKGHFSYDCKNSKKCHNCGDASHVKRDC